MKPPEELKRLIHESEITPGLEADERILRNALNELEKRRQERTEPLDAALWRALMKNRMTKFGTVAVLIIAALLAFQFLGNPFGTNLTFANVIEPILNADTASYDIVASLDDGSTSVTHYAVMGSLFRRTSVVGGEEVISIMDSENGRILQLNNKIAQYIYFEEDPSTFQNWRDDLKNRLLILEDDPDYTVEELGRKQLDGKEVIGFHAYNPAVFGGNMTIWADVDTGLPVRIETNYEIDSATYGKHKIQDTLKNMEFGLPMDDEMFSMEVPAGYYVLEPMTLEEFNQMGTEAEFIEGLGLIAEINDGYFPDGVSPDDYQKWIPEAVEWLEEMNLPKEEIEARLLQITKGLRAYFQFFPTYTLSEDEWTYLGQGVMLGETGTPILWYRPKGSETYRVIYGDLHVENVYPEDLPE